MFLQNVEFFCEVNVDGGASVGKRHDTNAVLGLEQFGGVLLNPSHFDLTAKPVHSAFSNESPAARVAGQLLEFLGGVQARRI